MTKPAAPAPEVAHPWTAATLRAARLRVKLTQEKLADLAGIGREYYISLETGRRKLTPLNAGRIAPHVRKRPDELLPPPTPAPTSPDPYALLQRLAKTVEKQQTTLEVLQGKMEALEHGASTRQRGRRGGQ